MSVFTPKRVVLFVVAVLLAASALANNPSPRVYARMAFDEKAEVGVLFGGRGPFDGATQLFHNSDETWFWSGSKWVQAFPLHSPDPRSAQSMIYDSTRERVVLFGGRREPIDLKGDPILFNDTWVWQNDDWSKLDTPAAPSARHNAGMTYDPVNDRIVLFGGTRLNDKFEPEAIFDTWEFDGTTWAQAGSTGQPDVAKPILAYDAERAKIIMMGVDKDDLKPVMFGYDSAAKSWSAITPEKLPPCVNEGNMVYRPNSKTLYFMGGICTTDTNTLDEAWQWDGTNWAKITTTNALTRLYGQAVMFDAARNAVVVEGGSLMGTTGTNSDTTLFRNNSWKFLSFSARPYPRSLSGFQTDPVNNNVWLFGGLFESSQGYLTDLWGYRGTQWYPITVTENAPGGCANPNTAFDTDRNRLVVVCGAASVFEFDPATFTWKTFTLTKTPDTRRFSNMVYDKKLKKTVLFGGYGTNNYFDDTWTWDGTAWTEIKINDDKQKPENRGLAMMWYDQLQEKTILYGGIGRPNLDSKAARYADMWSFNGSTWTKLSVSQTPGERLGAQIAVNPESGKLLLLGGLRAESDEDGKVLRQFYANDTWEWNGTGNTWTELHPDRSPAVRENGMMAWDPLTRELVVFGGYALGFYHSDVWAWNGQTWRPLIDQSGRRRPATPEPVPPAPASSVITE